MNPYREPGKPVSRLKEFFIDRARRITPLTVLFAALLLAGIALAATPALRINGLKFPDGSNDFQGVYNVKSPEYGCKGDGVTDDTTCVQAAVTACEAATGGTVHFPTGTYIITGTITMHRGTFLKGAGTQGSTIGYGTVIKHKVSSTNLFVWDGNGATVAAGTGGGAEDMFIAKAQTYTGGDAIYIVGTDDNHRPGEMRFRNILIGGENNAALWSRGFHADGTANTTAGGRGVRSFYLEKVRVSGTDGTGFPNKAIHLSQVTHFFANHLEIDPVGGDGAVGMTIDGNFDQVYIPSLEVNGSVVIAAPPDGAYNPNVYITGRAGTAFTVNATTVVGEAHILTASLTNSSGSFNVVNAGASSASSGSFTNVGGLFTVQDAASPLAGDLFVVRDNPGNKFLEVTDNAAIFVKPNGSDGASVVGLEVNSIASWVNAGAKLIRALNQGVEKYFVRADGLVSQNGGAGVGSNAFDYTGSSGAFKTPTGAVTVGPGAITVSGAPVFASVATTASGTSSFDLSGGSGIFKTSTGANTFGGSSNTFTNGITAPSATLTAGAGSTGKAPVTIFSDTTATCSTTAGETDGSSFTMLANTMNANGYMIRIHAGWIHAANTNSTTFKLYINGVAQVNTTNATSNDLITVDSDWVRTTSSTASYHHVLINSGGAMSGGRGTFSSQNFAGNIIIKISVTGAVANSDLCTNYLRVEAWPN